jgi:hypothetical protein
MLIYRLMGLVVLTILTSCNSVEAPAPPITTSLDSFGANPSPSPVNVATTFSWSVTGNGLTCALDVDNNNSTDYTVSDCTSSNRIMHIYPAVGSYTAQLTVTDGRGSTLSKTTSVVTTDANQAPTVLSFTANQGNTPNMVRFNWSVSDPNNDTLRCRLDANGDGQWELDQLCNNPTGSANQSANVIQAGVDLELPDGRYQANFEVADAYSVTQRSLGVRSPYNRLPQITQLDTTATSSNRVGQVQFAVSDPDGDPLSCTLNVESVGQFRYPNCSHITREFTFANDGTYAVSVIATDPYAGSGSRSATLTFSSESGPIIEFGLHLGEKYGCYLSTTGQTYCWGTQSDSAFSSDIPIALDQSGVPGGLFTQISAGGSHACGLDLQGRAYCWGKNSDGQLGNGGYTASWTPIAVDMSGIPGGRFSQISAGISHSCAITPQGKGYCWGGGTAGQLGTGSNSSSATPLPVDMSLVTEGAFSQISATSKNFAVSCGIAVGGNTYCWGSNFYNGGLGIGAVGDSNKPTSPILGNTFSTLASGMWYVCGLNPAGAVYCWGLVTPAPWANFSATPIAVPGATLTSLSAGSYSHRHTCGITASQAAYCFGFDDQGQLGDASGDSTTASLVPVSIGPVLSIGTGHDFTCALTVDYLLQCWGTDADGRLGNGPGDTTSHSTPAPVDMSNISVP